MKAAMGGTAYLPAEERQNTRPVGVELNLHRVACGHVHRSDPQDGNCETVQYVSTANANHHMVTLVEDDFPSPGWLSPPIVIADNAFLRPNAPVSGGRERDESCSSWISL